MIQDYGLEGVGGPRRNQTVIRKFLLYSFRLTNILLGKSEINKNHKPANTVHIREYPPALNLQPNLSKIISIPKTQVMTLSCMPTGSVRAECSSVPSQRELMRLLCDNRTHQNQSEIQLLVPAGAECASAAAPAGTQHSDSGGAAFGAGRTSGETHASLAHVSPEAEAAASPLLLQTNPTPAPSFSPTPTSQRATSE